MDWISAQLWKDTSSSSSHHLVASSNWFKALQALAPEDSKIFRNDRWIDSFVFYVIYQEPATVFHRDIKHREEESGNSDEQWSIIVKIRGVRIADETLCRVFDIFFSVFSQSKQERRSRWRIKIVKIYAYFEVSKSPSGLWFSLS